jgi:hypothetical protein
MRCLCCGVAWVRKGVTHTLTRDEGDATQALKRDIAELSACMQPMDVSALRQRGDERFKQKDFHGAVEAYSLLLQVSSPRPPRGEAADAGSARAPLPTSLAWAPFRRVSGGGRTQAPREASAPRRLALPFAWLGVSSCASAHLLTRRRGRTQMRGDGGPEVRKERLAAFANRAACHLCHSDFGLAVDDADRGLALLLGRVHLAAGEEEVRGSGCSTPRGLVVRPPPAPPASPAPPRAPGKPPSAAVSLPLLPARSLGSEACGVRPVLLPFGAERTLLLSLIVGPRRCPSGGKLRPPLRRALRRGAGGGR